MEIGESSHPRRPTRQIMVGDVPVGGGAPVTVQSMTITKTADHEATLEQIYALAGAGADLVRCTCNEDFSITCEETEDCADCEYEGDGYKIGQTWPAGDGCNICQCEAKGSYSCTETACN